MTSSTKSIIVDSRKRPVDSLAALLSAPDILADGLLAVVSDICSVHQDSNPRRSDCDSTGTIDLSSIVSQAAITSGILPGPIAVVQTRRTLSGEMQVTVEHSTTGVSPGGLQSAVSPADQILSGAERLQLCTSCKKPITERYMLKALDTIWHEDCLKCSCCDCRLGEVGSTLYTRANLLLCRRDYLRLFGATGFCSACSKTIPAFEMVMKAKGNVYHLDCFACQNCNHRFCIGDRYYLLDNKILCELDYEERTMCNRITQNYTNSLSQLKKQAQSSVITQTLSDHPTGREGAGGGGRGGGGGNLQ